MDRGFFITLHAMRRQLTAMPCDYYQIRLIHGCNRTPFPGDQVWSAVQLSRGGTVRFLRLRNREGYDVFIQPFDGDRNAGYILVDLDCAEDNILDTMRARQIEAQQGKATGEERRRRAQQVQNRRLNIVNVRDGRQGCDE